MFAYHEATKHTVESIYGSRHVLDWANMPDPFRHYEGVPVIDLPADPPAPRTPALDVLRGVKGGDAATDGLTFLSRLLYYSASISATKVVPSAGYRYALRVNPSSGNLHPTEFHFAARGLRGVEDGLYHYRVSSHMAEQRARGDVISRLQEAAGSPLLRNSPLIFLLTSIAWREAWKYRNRAYRYCLHDAGHAWQALALAARALGCEAFAVGEFPDDRLSRFACLSDEWPLLLVALRGPAVPVEDREHRELEWLGGKPNVLSPEAVEYPLIEEMHEASKLGNRSGAIERLEGPRAGRGTIALRPAEHSETPFGAVARRRRSALDFRGGYETISFEQLSTLLEATEQPFHADFEGDVVGGSSMRLIQLYLYVHRVRGLEPGVYRLWRPSNTLERLKWGDQRVIAAGLSLSQDLAGNACVAFSMVGDLNRAARQFGNRGYRYVFMEAGAIGQRLYLCAEALGFQATGIGAFYDDQVHRYLEIPPEQGQVVYHFACGYAVHDPRLGG